MGWKRIKEERIGKNQKAKEASKIMYKKGRSGAYNRRRWVGTCRLGEKKQ
jgi:hypothetical protein